MNKAHYTPNRLIEVLLAGFAILLLALGLLWRPLLFTLPESPVAQTANPQTKSENSQQGVAGIDVSHDQGSIQWQQVANSGIRFVYHKASDGETWQDPNFAHNVAAVTELALDIGPYHFFEAEDDPSAQAQNFLTTIKDKPLTLAPMVDVEITRNQSKSEIQSRLSAFIKTVEKATGCKPIIYSYKDFWQSYIGTEFNAYPFWLADYSAKMTAPEGVTNLLIWQHSSSGTVPGISVSVDLDTLLSGEKGLTSLQCNYKGDSHAV